MIDYRIWYDNASGTFTVLQEGLQLSYTALNLIESYTYQFKVQARNIYGYSDYSSIVSILAGQIPDKPVAPVTTWIRDFVIISWIAPDNGGSWISSYTIYVMQSDTVTYSTELNNCDGSVPYIRNGT